MSERRSKRNGKKPNINRYARLRECLANDLFNQNYVWVDTKAVSLTPKKYNMVDLFSGAGGITLGFTMASFEPIFSVDADPDASATYRRNFLNAFHYEGLIENISDEEALNALEGRQVHVLCAGFPCQGFSVAGARNANDVRNQLFLQVVRFAKLFSPWFIIGENVPGIVTIEGGSFYKRIINAFTNAGYPDMTALILESAAYGVPQIRPRAIFISNRFGLPNPYPKPLLNEQNYIPIELAIEDLKHRSRDPNINHEWTRHSQKMEERLSKVPPGGSLYSSYTDAWKRQYRRVPAMTIKENHGGVHIHYELNRTISAREMARLQSFPDDFIFSGRMKRVMFQVGNAIPPLLAKHIALALRPSLDRISHVRGLAEEKRASGTGRT